MRKSTTILVSTMLALLLGAGPVAVAAGETHTITARSTSFDPNVVFIEPGDSVRFTNMVGHDAVTIDGLIPDGASGFQFAMGEEGSATLETEGVYIYKCTPHYAMGQVGAIVVGDPVNIDTVEAEATGMAQRAVNAVKEAL